MDQKRKSVLEQFEKILSENKHFLGKNRFGSVPENKKLLCFVAEQDAFSKKFLIPNLVELIKSDELTEIQNEYLCLNDHELSALFYCKANSVKTVTIYGEVYLTIRNEEITVEYSNRDALELLLKGETKAFNSPAHTVLEAVKTTFPWLADLINETKLSLVNFPSTGYFSENDPTRPWKRQFNVGEVAQFFRK